VPFHTWLSNPSCRLSIMETSPWKWRGIPRVGQASVVPTLGEAEVQRPLPRQMIWQLKQWDCLSWLRGHARPRRSRTVRAHLRASDWAPAIDRVEEIPGVYCSCGSEVDDWHFQALQQRRHTPQIRRATAHASRPRDILELFHPSNLCRSGRNGISSLYLFLRKST
jgi:hypothetical protein